MHTKEENVINRFQSICSEQKWHGASGMSKSEIKIIYLRSPE